MQAFIQVGTISQAMHAKKVLEQHGVRAYVRRTAHTSGQGGCGYHILVTHYSPDMAAWLREDGVSVLDVKGRGAP